MNHGLSRRCFAILLTTTIGASAAAADVPPTASWGVPSRSTVFAQIERYMVAEDIEPAKQAAVRDAWQDNSDTDILTQVALSLAKCDARVDELVRFCSEPIQPGRLPEFAWLADSATPAVVRHNLRLYLARNLAQQAYYEEALAWTDGLSLEDVADPRALLFYRAVANHQLVHADDANRELRRLLEREGQLPVRYQKLAELMRKDLARLENDSLDHIARRMEDVRRRLALGRSGERVQEVENGVIESLDKLIQQIEDQMQQQAQSAASAGSQQSGTPMEESQIAELKAPGKVEPRDIGDSSGWGNLPEKDREKALQEIGREFPSHYREVIEEYFRQLAAEESDDRP